jgi:hypothetical protein
MHEARLAKAQTRAPGKSGWLIRVCAHALGFAPQVQQACAHAPDQDGLRPACGKRARDGGVQFVFDVRAAPVIDGR